MEKLRPRLDEVVTVLRKRIESNPRNARAHLLLGNALAVQDKRSGEAVKEYRLVLKINPTHIYAHLNLGITLSQQHDWSKAVAELKETIRLAENQANMKNAARLLI